MNASKHITHCTAWLLSGALALTLGACAEEQGARSGAPSSGGSDAIADAVADGASDAAADGRAALGAGEPSIAFTKPPENATPGELKVQADPATGTADLEVAVEVDNATVGPDSLQIRYFLDGNAEATVDAPGTFTFQNVSPGRHHVAARLVEPPSEPDGSFSALDNEESVDKVPYLTVFTSCETAADCQDGLSCSEQNCLDGQCRYGPVEGECCEHDLQCSFGETCHEGTCKECLEDADCDDGNPCTTDTCDPSGQCQHQQIEGCCAEDSDCDDGDVCTTDTCNTETNTCEFEETGGELCCNNDAECEPEDPCTAYVCYRNHSTGKQTCRYGPSERGCCTEDSECSDGNPCTKDVCDIPDGQEAGTCTYPDNPDKPQCCVSDSDCDDGDPATSDSCVDNTCQYEEDPLYCELPNTSDLVISEMMIAPREVADEHGEWLELYNASDEMIDLTGYVLETDAGESHEITAANAVGGPSSLQVFPGQYVVLGRSADEGQNGGFLPNYEYGDALSFPDKFEVGGEVTRTVRVRNPEGELVDEVPYDTATWRVEDGRTLALVHTHADNSKSKFWSAGGTADKAIDNRKYGEKSNDLWGTPHNENTDVARALDHDGCTPPDDESMCAVGRCNMDSTCVFPIQDGCCTKDEHCDDYDPCTVNTCNTETNECNPPETKPSCCDENADCDDGNPCNLDRCIGNVCRYSSNVVSDCCVTDADCEDGDQCTVNTCDEQTNQCQPPQQVSLTDGTCCNSDADCDDGDPATDDICDFNTSPPTCKHVQDDDYCSEDMEDPDARCDDGNPCTVDFCNTSTNTCVHEEKDAQNCCQENSDCDDGNPCTKDVCDADTGECSHEPIEDCCTQDSQCDDGNPCTDDFCTASNVCHHQTQDGCCTNLDGDSGVQDCKEQGLDTPCQELSCQGAGSEQGGTCEKTAIEDCCDPEASSSELVSQCGQDPDGEANCYQWNCTESGACELLQNDNCCSTDADCDDGDPCTEDVCTADNACKHLQQSDGQCCTFNTDCSDQDGNPCTTPVCDGGMCTEEHIDGCVPSIPIDAGPDSGMDADGWKPSSAESCWVDDTENFLGPDTHAECFGSQGAIGDGAILAAPGFDPSGADDVSIQFQLGWDNGSGTHEVEVLATTTQGDFTGAETLDLIDVSGSNDGERFTYNLSNALAAERSVWIGFRVSSDAPNAVDVAVDDFVAASGHAPFFVEQLKSDKSYDPDGDSITDAGTVNVQLNSPRQRVLWSADEEWQDQTLNFELLNAPDFVSVESTTSLFEFGVWQVTLDVAPTKTAHLGSYDLRVRVQDEHFVDVVELDVEVSLGKGYVLWTPEGTAEADATALSEALNAHDLTFQRVSSPSEVKSWSQVKGVFITAGGADATHTFTDEEVQPIVDYVEGGGDVYLEGSAAFGEGVQTDLQKLFQVKPLEMDSGLSGTASGRSFLWGQSWSYTSEAAYADDVDTIAPAFSTGTKTVLAGDADGAGLAVAYENGETVARTVASTVLLSQLQSEGTTKKAYVGAIIDFFKTGYPGCQAQEQCDDNKPCTIDKCVGGQCTHEQKDSCDICEADADCEGDKICRSDGQCVEPEGEDVGGGDEETDFNCDTTDESIQLTHHTSGFEEIQEADVHARLTVAEEETLGDYRITLAHNGEKVTLVEPDESRTGTAIDQTWDVSAFPDKGTMAQFEGQVLHGDWILTVTDIDGGQNCGTIEDWNVFVETSDEPIGCDSDADCDNSQFCDGQEVCQDGSCQAGADPACDDENPCTQNLCDSAAEGSTGACDHSRRTQSCADEEWPCSGGNAIDAGDGQCGLQDACQGGLAGGEGTCTKVCPDECSVAHTGVAEERIPNHGCHTETLEFSTGDGYVDKGYLRVDVDHENLGDLTVSLYSPGNSEAPVLQREGDELANAHSTFPFSNPKEKYEQRLCSLQGVNPNGTWKVQVCDEREPTEGTLRSASVWLDTTDEDPTVGNSCGNPMMVDTSDGTKTFTENTKCFSDETEGCGSSDGHDAVYQFQLDTTKRVTASLSTQAEEEGEEPHDGVLYITESCSSSATQRCSNTASATGTESIDTHIQPGTYYVVADGTRAVEHGPLTLELIFQTPYQDGEACDEDLDCSSIYCENGYCCDGPTADCCAEPSHCPDSYRKAPMCHDTETPTECQGHRVDATCKGFQCGSKNVADDSACGEDIEANKCGLFVSIFCTGEKDQDPQCLETCVEDDQCDPEAHCYLEGDETCRLDQPTGSECTRDGHCASGECYQEGDQEVGVCCESACDSNCKSCRDAHNGNAAAGECNTIPSGDDPYEDCAGASDTCGGTCDGGGGCQFPDQTVACDTCMRCDGQGFCDNAVADGTDNPTGGDYDFCPTCEVCNGSGACRAAGKGQDPMDECPDEGTSACGLDGECNGQSQCGVYDQGTECAAQTCADGYVDPPHTCEGPRENDSRTCTQHDDIFCEGLICDGNECRSECADDTHCISGYFCLQVEGDPEAGSCKLKKEDGEACASDHQCQSNFCTDGVCCDKKCAGPCRKCDVSGSVGQCTLHDEHTDPEDGCGRYFCDGEGACQNFCEANQDCKSDFWCNGDQGECKPKRELGEQCSASDQCHSGQCTDGVCCDSACDGLCEKCDLDGSVGQCKLVPSGQDPDNECAGTHDTCGGTCDGNGSCQFPSATTDCGTCKRCDGEGFCKAVPENEDPDGDCGTCRTCSGNASCKNTPEGEDFQSECEQQSKSTCGYNGVCDGNAACDYYGAGTVAEAPSCSDGVAELADTCDGSGNVQDGGTEQCAPYVCDGDACRTSCSDHGHCQDGFFCDFQDLNGNGRTSECIAKQNNGEQCSEDFECGSGFCSNGFCCDGSGDDLCCSGDADCQELAVAPTCDTSQPGGCDGHRVDATCDGNKVCQTTRVDDDSACEGRTCEASTCYGSNDMTFRPDKTCNASGSCTLDGSTTNCDDGKVCTDDACDPESGCSHTNNDDYSRECYTGPSGTAGTGPCETGTQECSGGDLTSCEGEVTPSTESCNGVDDDCDGQTDEAGAEGCTTYYKDGDDDGYGSSESKCLCDGPSDPYDADNNNDCDDNDSSVHPGATEVCNGKDDDCNDGADEEGAQGCTDVYYDGDRDGYGSWYDGCECNVNSWEATNGNDCNDDDDSINPGENESCNNVDDDCDGSTDEGLTRSCSTDCGSGTESCRNGNWVNCDAPSPSAETCNNVDDDCDGSTDEGLTQLCSTKCEIGTESCSNGSWGGCSAESPSSESCNNEDDDCDGSTDENLTRHCSTACGSGDETCSNGSWGSCDAPSPDNETCNDKDDDCDGATDEHKCCDWDKCCTNWEEDCDCCGYDAWGDCIGWDCDCEDECQNWDYQCTCAD